MLFRFRATPRILKQMGFGIFFMILGIGLSRYDPNMIFFIFGASFCLCGLVLFFMGVINGILETIRHFIKKDTT